MLSRAKASLDPVTLTLGSDDALTYESNQLTAPPRVYVDLAQVDVEPSLHETPYAYDDGVVRSIRLGRHPDLTTRVVLDLDEGASFAVSTLQDPVRLIVEVAACAAGGAGGRNQRLYIS